MPSKVFSLKPESVFNFDQNQCSDWIRIGVQVGPEYAPNQDVKRILSRIDTLSDNPRGEGCIKLSGQERYRVRQGLYRIIYEIQDDRLVVQVVKVGHRSSIYEGN